MSEKPNPQDDHWYSLVSQLGLTPPELERDASTKPERPIDAPAADDRGDVFAAGPACNPASDAADDRSDLAAQGGAASLSDQGNWGGAALQRSSPANVRSEDSSAVNPSGTDAARGKPSIEPRPTTDWDLLAEELGIAPARETDNSSAAAPTSETAAGDEYVATPQRVRERIDVFERTCGSHTASAEDAFGAGLLDPLAAESSADHGRRETSQPSSQDMVSDPATSEVSEPERAADEEDRPPRNGKKRKRRRRKAKASRSAPESRTSQADAKIIDPDESEPIDPIDAEPAWLDGEDEASSDGADEPSDRRTGHRDRPPRDSRGESRKAPSAEEPARPARVRADRNDDEPFDDDGDDDELRPAHKQIPTWEQAVGSIIQANIEARSRRGEGSRNRGRSGGRR